MPPAHETHIQKDYVVKLFTNSEEKGGLGYRQTEPNVVTNNLFIPSHLAEFMQQDNPMGWKALLRVYHQDEKQLLQDLMEEIRRRLLNTSNVAIFFNRNKTITFKGETLRLFYVSGSETQGDDDFQKNIFAVVPEKTHNCDCAGITMAKIRPDLSFFLNGIFFGYMELKSQSSNQSARKEGRNKVMGDYLQVVLDITNREKDDPIGVEQDRKETLRIFERAIHLTTSDIQETYILRNVGAFYDKVHKDFKDESGSISTLRPILEKEFKIYPVTDQNLSAKERFEENMFYLYSKKMIEREILLYNFLQYTYNRVGNKYVYSSRKSKLIVPRPKQKFGCDMILNRVQEMLRKESEPDFYAEKLRTELLGLHVRYDDIEEILAKREAYYNNKYVYSLLLQYAAGFGKSNIIGWTSLMLKNLRYNDEWAYDKIMIVVDRIQLRNQLTAMMQNMNIDDSLFVEAYNQDTLVRALSDMTKRIVIVNIQKFLDLRDALTRSRKKLGEMRVAFLIDEIHRSNSGSTNEEMLDIFSSLQKAITDISGTNSKKKNLLIGLTATPSDKVLARFGEFKSDKEHIPLWIPFDAYTMKESIADGYTLDPTAHIIPVEKKMIFDLPAGVDYDDDEHRISIEKEKIYAHPERMKAYAEFIVERLLSQVYGKIHGYGKAMLAVSSIPNAISYCKLIRKLFAERCQDKKYTESHYENAPIAIVYSDNQEYESCASMNDGKKEDKVIEEFQKAKNGLIIVVDKLQTGFDEPKLHTLFLDKEIADINAIQTICRVNRKHENKVDCHIVDLSWRNVNVGNIKEAFAKYCGMVVSQLNPDTETRMLDEIYQDLSHTEPFTRWFADFYLHQNEVDFTMKLEDNLRQWIKQQFDQAAAAKQQLTDAEERAEVTNEARRIKKQWSKYCSELLLLENVYEIDAKYNNKQWLEFWELYYRIYRFLMMGNGSEILHPDVDTDDRFPGLTVVESDEEGGTKGPSGGGSEESGPLPTIGEMISRWNEQEEMSAEEALFWENEIRAMFDEFLKNQTLIAVLCDTQFTEDRKNEKYQTAFRAFLRQVKRRPDAEHAATFTKLLTDNQEMLYAMFRERVEALAIE